MRFGTAVVLVVGLVSLCLLAGCGTTPTLSADQKAVAPGNGADVLRASHGGASIAPRTHPETSGYVRASSSQVLVAGPAAWDRTNGRLGIEKPKPREILAAKRGSRGGSDRQLHHAQVRAGNPSCYAYVVPSENHRIERYTSRPRSATKWGTLSKRDGRIGNPTGVPVGDSADMCLSDRFDRRIQKLTLVPWLPSACGEQVFRIR